MSEKKINLYEDFFDELTSEHTRLSYRSDLEQFFTFMQDYFTQFTNLSEIEKRHIVKFRNFLQETGGKDEGPCSPKTICRKLASISSYFNFLSERDLVKTNPVSSIKRPRSEVINPTNALNAEQVRDLLQAVNTNSKSGKMHFALLITFFTTGLRKKEVLQLRRKDYRTLNNHYILTYRGKGGKHGQKILHPNCVQALNEYLEWMKTQKREHIPEDWLFQPTRNPANPQNLNKPLNPKTINEILDSYAKKIGLHFKICPHSARATFIGQLLELGVDIYKVSQEVNHSSVKTTQEYDKRRKNLSESPIYKLNY